MNIQYEPQEDEITSDELRPDMYYQHGNYLGERQRVPTVIGIVQIICGLFTAFLGVLELLIVPMMENIHDTGIIQFNKKNCFGIGIIAGVLMVITGSALARASISRRKTSVIKFYNMTIFTFVIYLGLMVFMLVAYALGWTTRDVYPPQSRLHTIHMFVVLFTMLGMLFTLTSIVKYFNVVFRGEVQLWRQWVEFFRLTHHQLPRSGSVSVSSGLSTAPSGLN